MPRSTSETRYGYPAVITLDRTLLRLLRRFRLVSFLPAEAQRPPTFFPMAFSIRQRPQAFADVNS